MGQKKLTMREIQKIETSMLHINHEICKRNNIKCSIICGSVLGAARHHGPIPWDTDADISIPYDDYERYCEALVKELPDWCELYGYGATKDYRRYLPRIGVKGVDTAVLHVDIFPQVGLPDDKESQIKFSKRCTFLRKLYYYKIAATGDNLCATDKGLKLFVKKIARLGLRIVLSPFSVEGIRKKTHEHFSKYPYATANYTMNPCGHYAEKNVLPKKYYEDVIEADYDGIKLNIPREYDEYLTHYYKDWNKPVKDPRMENAEVWVDEDFDPTLYYVSE